MKRVKRQKTWRLFCNYIRLLGAGRPGCASCGIAALEWLHDSKNQSSKSCSQRSDVAASHHVASCVTEELEGAANNISTVQHTEPIEYNPSVSSHLPSLCSARRRATSHQICQQNLLRSDVPALRLHPLREVDAHPLLIDRLMEVDVVVVPFGSSRASESEEVKDLQASASSDVVDRAVALLRHDGKSAFAD